VYTRVIDVKFACGASPACCTCVLQRKGQRGAGVSPDVQALTGHAPRRFADFVAENAAAWR
jgi:hypothetical protein